MNNLAVETSESPWVRFWHAPVRAERLALMRIFLAAFLLGDQLLQFLPGIPEFYGPDGIGASGIFDERQLKGWHWTYFFFGTENLSLIYPVFWLWVATTFLFLVGWKTRWMSVLVWLLTRCFEERNPNVTYGGDSVLVCATFLLMFAPCGDALSLDAWRKRRQGLLSGPAWVAPWSLRLLQIQLCLIYFSTGLVKLQGKSWLVGTWLDGTSLHYFLNDSTMARKSFAEYPIPFWITMPATYLVLLWEVLFPFLLLNRWTRRFCLVFGVMMHLGILVTVAIDWFVFYTLTFYALWIPDWFWARFDKAVNEPSDAAPLIKIGQDARAI